MTGATRTSSTGHSRFGSSGCQTPRPPCADDLHCVRPGCNGGVRLKTISGLKLLHECDGILVGNMQPIVTAWLGSPLARSASIVDTKTPGWTGSVIGSPSVGHNGRMACLPCIGVATDVLEHGVQVFGHLKANLERLPSVCRDLEDAVVGGRVDLAKVRKKKDSAPVSTVRLQEVVKDSSLCGHLSDIAGLEGLRLSD